MTFRFSSEGGGKPPHSMLAIAAVVVLSACGVKPVERTQEAAVSAPVEIVQPAALAETRITTGTVRSTNVSPLAAKVMGNVTRVLVSEGDRVRAGQPLVEIDSRDLRARSDQAVAQVGAVDAGITAAQANADVMAATYKRFSVLRQRGSVSPQEFDEVSAKYEAAQAQLKQAQAQRAQARAGVAEAQTFVSYSIVRSPIDGVVSARMIDPGAQAAPGMPLLTVEDDAKYRVETTVDESLASRVRAGDAVTIDVGPTLSRTGPTGESALRTGPTGESALRTGLVSNIATVDPATRSALVKIDLPRHSGLRSGAFVRVAFAVGSRNGITIPETAIARRGQLTSVFVIDSHDTARMRLVTLGDPQKGRVEVLSGIDPGEKVVSRINYDIRDGVRVRS